MTDAGTLLTQLRGDAELARLLDWPFGFDVARVDHVEPVRLESGATLTPVAGDGTGGTYFLCGDGEALLYGSSEGESCLFGATLGQALEVLIWLPYWRDRLNHTGEDTAPTYTNAELEQDFLDDYPTLREAQATAATRLGLATLTPDEAIARLHAVLTTLGSAFVLVNDEGGTYDRPIGAY